MQVGADARAVVQAEVGLEVVVVVARARVVPAHRDAERAVVALADAEAQRGARADAVAGDDQRRAVGHRLALRAAAGVDAGDAAGALVDRRAGDRDALLDAGPGGAGVVGEHLVEVAPGAHEAVGGEGGELGPVELDARAAADDAQAALVAPAGLLAGVDAEVDELLHPARGHAVAADLLAGERRLLQDEHVEPGARQVRRDRGACGTGTHDDDIGVGVGAAARSGGGGGHGTAPCESVH